MVDDVDVMLDLIDSAIGDFFQNGDFNLEPVFKHGDGAASSGFLQNHVRLLIGGRNH
jgi:hypothetical protein